MFPSLRTYEGVVLSLPHQLCHEILELEASLDQKVRDGLMVPEEIEELLASDKVEYR